MAIGLSACVTKKKYGEMEVLKNKVQGMLDKKNKELKSLRAERAEMEAQLLDCETSRKSLAQDTARFGAVMQSLNEELHDLKTTCSRVKKNYKKLRSKSSAKMKDLVGRLESLQKNLRQREARLAEVEAKLRQRDSIVNAIQQRVSSALLGFQDDGLTVNIKNGKVYVSLSNKLLFASGSTTIDKNGQKALRDLAGILKTQEDVTIMVEGHTDDVPVSNLGRIKDNWDLSVMRSTEVVRLLVESGVMPSRIVPAGRGEFIPKVRQETDDARAANRRTEIIISPKLDELFELINASASRGDIQTLEELEVEAEEGFEPIPE
ncbi:MAG: OmpA family protein [Bacteroidota bacterium]